MKFKNYSLSRLLLAIPFLVLAILFLYGMIFTYSQPNYFVIVHYYFGVILFLLNRRLADNISLTIFIFAFSGTLAFWINKYLSCKECYEFYVFFFARPEELIFFVLSLLASIYLIVKILSRKEIK